MEDRHALDSQSHLLLGQQGTAVAVLGYPVVPFCPFFSGSLTSLLGESVGLGLIRIKGLWG